MLGPWRREFKLARITHRPRQKRCQVLRAAPALLGAGEQEGVHPVVRIDVLLQFYAHVKRGTEAMDEMGILPFYKGVLCHDHWTDFCSCKIYISTLRGGQTLLPL
jgi:hypothetical protein